MPEGEAPYDPYIPAGGQGQQQGAGNARTQALQAVSLDCDSDGFDGETATMRDACKRADVSAPAKRRSLAAFAF